jgi:hypothetical protein
MRSSDKMEKLVKTSIEASNEYNKSQMQLQKEMKQNMSSANTMVMEHERTAKDMNRKASSNRSTEDEDERQSNTNPGGFLRAAIRPFTYRNLVEEIVLMRQHIIDGEIV